jgi:hypothetical protein
MKRERVGLKLFKCFLNLPCNLQEGYDNGRFTLHPGGNKCNDCRVGVQVERTTNQGELDDMYIAEVCSTCPVLALELSRFGYNLDNVPVTWIV